jgi:HSP20 family protein
MALVRWNPWGELFNLHSQMDDLFQALSPAQSAAEQGDIRNYVQLPVDIRQSEEAFTIEASVPGYKPDQVELTFDDGVLTIKGTRSEDSESKDGEWVRRERRMASVYRQVGLPAEVRPDEITASFDNGVLSINVPRAQRAQPKRIPVTGGASNGQPRVIEHQTETASPH